MSDSNFYWYRKWEQASSLKTQFLFCKISLPAFRRCRNDTWCFDDATLKASSPIPDLLQKAVHGLLQALRLFGQIVG